ncbi:unnamed protein product, partial [Effrenium voratum]
MCAWPDQYAGVCQRRMPNGVLHYLAHSLRGRRYRTMFSGVDAPGVALYSMTAMVKDYLNIPSMEGPSHESAVEWNVSCQDELQSGPCKPKHLFRDIKGFFKPEVLATIQSVRERGLPLNRHTVMPMLHSGKATKRTSFCVLHQKECVVEPCREAYAGFPCVSWSPQGSRQRDDSEDFDCWCAMAALVLDVEDDCVIVECSHMYDTSILAEAWNPKYASFFVVIDAMNFGTASRRQRMWGACISRSTITQSWSSLQNVIPMFYRCVAASFDFSHYLIATRDELDAELKWAMTRPKSLASGKSLDELKRSPRPFWEALTAKEQEFELKYAKVHQPSVARSLNQNPDKHGQASQGRVLHAMIKNCGVVWLPSADRWLAPSELLASQAFPVRPELASPTSKHSHLVCSFAADAASGLQLAPAEGVPRKRTHASVVSQMGNSMNVACCGAMAFYSILCTRTSSEMAGQVEEMSAGGAPPAPAFGGDGPLCIDSSSEGEEGSG